MNYIISGKNIEVTEGLRNAVQDKLSEDRGNDSYEGTYHQSRAGER